MRHDLVRSLLGGGAVLFFLLLLSGCGSGGNTVQPPSVEAVSPDAPVDEPPSTDEQ